MLDVKEYDPSKLSKPNLIVGVPEAGLVGTIAASYLSQQLHMTDIGHVESDLVGPIVVVHEGKAQHPIRILGGQNNLAVVISEVPLPPGLAVEFGNAIVNWANSKESPLLVGVTSIPFEGRLEQGEQGEKPKVLALATEERLADRVKQIGTEPFMEGMLIGTYAAIVKQAILLRQPSLTILAEAYPQFPDPGAAAAVIEVLNRVLYLQVDVGDLLKQSEEIRIRMRQLMARTRENMKKMADTTPSLYT